MVSQVMVLHLHLQRPIFSHKGCTDRFAVNLSGSEHTDSQEVIRKSQENEEEVEDS